MNLLEKFKKWISQKSTSKSSSNEDRQTSSEDRQEDTKTKDKKEIIQKNSENPYLTARRTWNEHVGSIISTSQIWQVIVLFSLMITLASIGGVIYIGSQSKIVPYVLEVDKLGEVRGLGRVTSATRMDPRILGATVANFIEKARIVTPDIALQSKAIFYVYAHLALNDPATVKMNEWLKGAKNKTPIERSRTEMVSVTITSTLPQTPTTWQVEWTEITRDRKGILKGNPVKMRALITVYISETITQSAEKQLQDNPLGIYVRDFSWQELH